jgi:PAS domain S-box-containing protein|tara:strand:+ start:69711 stop:71786 length:2076 start_codon:yes stop_codon:yes gene_type:complete
MPEESQSEALNPPKVDWTAILDQLPYGLIVLGPGQDLQYENTVCRDLLGSTIQEKGGIEDWLASACPNDEHRDRVINSWRDHIWRNQLTRSFTLRGADQKLREIEFRATLHADGTFTVTLQDITDLHRAEETQRHNKLKFRAMFAHAGDGAVLVDRTGRVIDANPAFLNFAELSLKEIHLSTLASLLNPEDATTLANAQRVWRENESPEAPETITKDVWLRTRSKEKRAELTYCPVGDSKQNPSMGIYLFQIGETAESRAQLLGKLQTVAIKAQALLKAVPDLVLLINKDLTVADFAPPPSPWKELKPNDSWRGQSLNEVWPILGEIVDQSLLSVFAQGQTIQADIEGCGVNPFDFNFTLCSCGDDQMLAVIRRLSQKSEGRVNGWSTPVLQMTSQAIIVADINGEIREANLAFAELIGLSPSDIIGHSISELYRTDQGLKERLTSLQTHPNPWSCELPLILKTGRELNVITDFVPVSEQGSPACVVGLVRNAAAPLKQAQAELDKSQHRFRNQLQLVTSLFSLEPQGSAARDAFLKWQIRLRSVAQTMNGDPDAGVQVVPMARTIADEICSLTGHASGSREIKITGDEGLRINRVNSDPLALMIGEILRLILGHRQYGSGPQLSLSFHRDDERNIYLRVKPGENRRFIFTDEDSEIEILEILTVQMGGELAPLASESNLAWELKIPAERS